ncbi:hypothetical protein FGE12_24090 [Aggregicoccus sp. 17bor-14]|uniref:hypothetical protein n=1 Tax=Myxococcaceae TaxID=31 RepID=UPI00129C51D1|nr:MULTISPECIES: hypothetical protein [Myxococcaceae]MBF5045510.1 hypothetical protein [Simulacricoccus sp. 17bor-14]MRI91247.1 hypothetical protein [Aggregicoccus sp. 17bor-14]
MPPALSPTPAELARALRALPPREAALLRRVLLEGQGVEACAGLYGSSPEALAVHLLRACLALEAALVAAAPVRVPDAEEPRWAARLVRALEGGRVAPGAVGARHLKQHAAAVRAELAAAEEQELRSPQHRRNEWLRRLAVALLLALTAWYTLHRPPEPPARVSAPRR